MVILGVWPYINLGLPPAVQQKSILVALICTISYVVRDRAACLVVAKQKSLALRCKF